MESSEGLEKEGSDTIKTTITKSDLVRSLLGDGEKQETFDGHPRPDDGRNVLPTWRTLAVDARGNLIRPMHGVASDWSLLLHLRSTRRAKQTQSYDDTIDLKNQIYLWITKVAAVLAAGRPSERIFEYRYEEFTKEFRRATRALGLKNIVPYQCRHSGASLDKAGQHRTMLEIKKTVKVEVRQQHCPVRKIWKTGAGPVRSQQKSTNLLRSHRLSSRGAYLWETPSRGRFAPSLMVAASS